MDEAPSVYPNLNDETKIIEDYFITDIWETMSEKLGKYVAAFDYIDKTLIVLSATSDGVSIASFTSVIGAPVGIASVSLSFAFSFQES